MSTRRSIVSNGIYCLLTERNVAISTEIVEIYALGSFGPVARNEGRRWCNSADPSVCPHDCAFISGGKGWGINPATGERVTTN